MTFLSSPPVLAGVGRDGERFEMFPNCLVSAVGSFRDIAVACRRIGAEDEERDELPSAAG